MEIFHDLLEHTVYRIDISARRWGGSISLKLRTNQALYMIYQNSGASKSVINYEEMERTSFSQSLLKKGTCFFSSTTKGDKMTHLSTWSFLALLTQGWQKKQKTKVPIFHLLYESGGAISCYLGWAPPVSVVFIQGLYFLWHEKWHLHDKFPTFSLTFKKIEVYGIGNISYQISFALQCCQKSFFKKYPKRNFSFSRYSLLVLSACKVCWLPFN